MHTQNLLEAKTEPGSEGFTVASPFATEVVLPERLVDTTNIPNSEAMLPISPFVAGNLNIARIVQGEKRDGVDRRVRRLNRFFGRRLGWRKQFATIIRLLDVKWASGDSDPFKNAVATWQRRRHLRPDGIIGPRTWRKMRRLLRRRQTNVLEGELTEERHAGGIRLSQGAVGDAFEEFVSHTPVPATVLKVLTSESRVKKLIARLDRKYVAASKRLANWKLGSNGKLTAGRLKGRRVKGKRVIKFIREHGREPFEPAFSGEHYFNFDALALAVPDKSSSDPKSQLRYEFRYWTTQLLYQLVSANKYLHIKIPRSGPINKLVWKQISNEVDVRLEVNRIARRIDGNSKLKASFKLGDVFPKDLTFPSPAAADFIPLGHGTDTNFMSTVVEHYALRALMTHAVREEGLSRSHIWKLHREADAVKLSDRNIQATLLSPFPITFDEKLGIFVTFQSKYAEFRFAKRVIDKRWRAIKNLGGINVWRDLLWMRQEHESSFFDKKVSLVRPQPEIPNHSENLEYFDSGDGIRPDFETPQSIEDNVDFEGQLGVQVKRRAVTVGEAIKLDLNKHFPWLLSLPGKFIINWSIPGTVVAGYQGNRRRSSVTSVTPSMLRQRKIKFHWVDAGRARKVTADIEWRLFTSIAKFKFTARFDVHGPKLRWFKSSRSSVRLGKRKKWFLEFGAMPKKPGIRWNWKVTLPKQRGGSIKDLQTIRQGRQKVQQSSQGNGQTITLVKRNPRKPEPHDQIDDDFANPGESVATYSQPLHFEGISYPQRVRAGRSASNKVTSDSPGFELDPKDISASVNETFKYYILFKPDTPDSIWVPVAKAEWMWKAEARRSGSRWKLLKKGSGVTKRGAVTTSFPLYLSSVARNKWRKKK